MNNFGYDIYLSKNIEIEKIKRLLANAYPEKEFLLTNFTDDAIKDMQRSKINQSYFYLHQHQDLLESQFPFHLQIENLSDEETKWEKAYALTQDICKTNKLYCFIEYHPFIDSSSPYDVLLYMPNGEIHKASDIDYAETGLIYPSECIKMPLPKLKIVGELIKSQDWNSDRDWVSAELIPTPFFENKAYSFRFEFANSTENYFEKAEEALQNFFKFNDALKIAAAEKAYENWLNFNEAVGYLDNLEIFETDINPPEWIQRSIKNLKWLKKLTAPEKVWEYISPLEIVVTKDRFGLDKEIYIQVLCNCAWEEEHGIQFIFKEGKELTRVSEQDGNLFE
jgi:hypothetical protein